MRKFDITLGMSVFIEKIIIIIIGKKKLKILILDSNTFNVVYHLSESNEIWHISGVI